MRRTWVPMLLLAALLSPAVGRAEEGPIVIAHRDQHAFLSLDPFHGSVGLTSIYEMDHSSSHGEGSSASEALFTQELTLSTGGNIVSPNLLKWSATGTAALEETWGQADGKSSSSTGVFTAYNVNADILSGTQYPISAYAMQSQGYITRAFAGMLRNTTSGYGVTAQYRSPSLPTTLSLSHSSTSQSELTGEAQFAVDQNTADFSTSFQPWERHNVTFNYSYGTVTQNNPGVISNASERHSINVNHDWSIDRDSRFMLTQAVNYSQQSGTYEEKRLRLAEQLRMKLTDTLDGSLDYTLERQQYPTSDVTSQLVSASLTHRLFESLTTTGRAGAALLDSSYDGTPGAATSSSKTYYASVASTYTKKMWLGRFGANLSLGISQNQSGAVGATQQVLGDVKTFNDPQPIILTRAGVDGGSVAVFDAGGTRRYVEGEDYAVRHVGNTVQIERLIGGNINSGDTVRLNYDVDPLPGYSSQSISFGTGANYHFEEGVLKGLNLYVRYYQVNQSISPKGVGITPDSIRDLTYGAEYQIWKVTLRAEEEIRSSTLAPFDALRLTATYSDALSERSTLSINASQSFIHMPNENSRMQSTSIDGRLQYAISRDLKAAVMARWRNDGYSDRPGVMGFEQQAELHWNLRQTDVYFILRHATLDAADGSQDNTILQLGVTRSF